jgi:hypothetical protein
LRHRHLFSIVEREHVRQVRIGIREGIIIICVIWRLLVSAGAWPERANAELLHHVLLVLLRRERHRCGLRIRGNAALREQAGNREAAYRNEAKNGGNVKNLLASSHGILRR